MNRFITRFSNNGPKKGLYVALVSEELFEGGYEVIRIAKKDNLVEYISKNLRLYIFEDEVDADEFGLLVRTYLKNTKKDCRAGQKFWPLYRKSIEGSYNYLQVNNIIPRRKNLENEFLNLDNLKIMKNKKKALDVSAPEQRVDAKKFWSI